MTASTEFYERVITALPGTESLTVMTVSGSTRDQVAAALSVDLMKPLDDPWDDGENLTAWAIHALADGVLAIELTGYGDPTLEALSTLSEDGGASAVVRSNVQAHVRFGCARNGAVLFDDDEYMYIEDTQIVPAELRALFDLVWDDLGDDAPSGLVVGLAMAELITGVEVAAEDVAAGYQSGFFAAPGLVYVGLSER